MADSGRVFLPVRDVIAQYSSLDRKSQQAVSKVERYNRANCYQYFLRSLLPLPRFKFQNRKRNPNGPEDLGKE